MNTIAKLSALMVTSVALAVTTATKRNNTSEVVVAPMGVPGNAVYGTGVGLVITLLAWWCCRNARRGVFCIR